jgi:hypothetical protein
MVEKTTPDWAIECADECGLSRTGHYACALASFLVALVLAFVISTILAVAFAVPAVLAPLAVVLGFFTLWAGTWIASEVVWDRWISRRTEFVSRSDPLREGRDTP